MDELIEQLLKIERFKRETKPQMVVMVDALAYEELIQRLFGRSSERGEGNVTHVRVKAVE